MELTKCNLNHIKVKQFTETERQIITKAVRKLATRRPNFYHDAIVEVAIRLTEESHDTTNPETGS